MLEAGDGETVLKLCWKCWNLVTVKLFWNLVVLTDEDVCDTLSPLILIPNP